jgi:hypothetical protein
VADRWEGEAPSEPVGWPASACRRIGVAWLERREAADTPTLTTPDAASLSTVAMETLTSVLLGGIKLCLLFRLVAMKVSGSGTRQLNPSEDRSLRQLK